MGISRYPRFGHRIAPFTLADVLKVPIPQSLKVEALPRGLKLYELDETVWGLLTVEICQQLSEAVVEQVRIGLPTLPDELKHRHLPLPSLNIELEALDIEARTYNCLFHAKFGENPQYFSKYTIGQLIKLSGFGAKCLVDLLSSLESMRHIRGKSEFISEEVNEIGLDVTTETLQTLLKRRAYGIKGVPHDVYRRSLPKLPDGMKLDDLELKFRTYNCLKEAGYLKRPQLLSGLPVTQLLAIRGFGIDSLIDLLTSLQPFIITNRRNPHTKTPSKGNLKGKRTQQRLFLAQQELNFPTTKEVTNEDVVREAKRLQRLSDLKNIRRDDPRLWQLLRAVDVNAKNAFEVAERLIAGLNVSVNSAATVQQLRDLQKRIRALSRMTLDEEVGELIGDVGSERNRMIIARRFAWDGGEGATLQEVGDSLGITRERVRQVCDRLTKRLEGKLVFTPALDRALKFVSSHLPGAADEIESKFISEGLTKGEFRLEGVLSAAEMFGRNVPFIITKVGGKRLALAPDMENIAGVISQASRRAIEHWGVSTVADVAARATERAGTSIDADLVIHVLSEKSDFRWLDESGGWFWLSSVPRNRLLNQIEKVLSVAERIDVTELRAGVSRHHRMKGVAPTKRVLLELCKQTSLYRVEGSTVIADPPLNWEETISDIEQFMVLTLKEHGPVMRRSEFEKLCIDLGINRVTFYAYLKYSPVIMKYAIGVYGLRGVQVLPGVIESLKPDFRQRQGRVLMDYGWTLEGKVWIGYKISEAMIKSGVVGVPGAIKRFVAGEFILKTEDGLQIGRLVARDSNAWGLGTFFRRRGGEVGDYLVILIDQAIKEATVYIGDENLLDEFQPGDESIETPQVCELVP